MSFEICNCKKEIEFIIPTDDFSSLINALTNLSRYHGDEAGHQEDTPWEYQYPTAPPYNGGGSGGYGGGHRGPTDQYPTGPIPYNSQQQPLIADQPPRYQDVAYSNYRDSGKIQY